MLQYLIYAAPAAGTLALLYAFWKAAWVKKQDPGTKDMVEIADQIQTGAMAFLKAEYRVLAIFVVIVAGLHAVANMNPDSSPLIALAFVFGAVTSAVAGWAGMKVATDANVRTTQAAKKGIAPALEIAFSGGAVMGMTVVGLASIGLSVLYIVFTGMFDGDVVKTVKIMTGFSMGASSIALFARVGGGIYTKAADVGADLVGKVEAGLPEDDPRNPAVIADNVGDNVGDVAGMGADLFESFVGAIIGTMVLGLNFVEVKSGSTIIPVILPLVLAAAGIICSIAGTFVVKTKEGGNPQHALDAGAFGAAGVMAVLTFVIANQFWPAGGVASVDILSGESITIDAMRIGGATVVGLITGVLVGLITSYYCSMGKPPVDSIAEQCKTGTATNIIAGLGVGMQSTALPIIVIATGVVASAMFAGLYGVAIAALGMLSTTGIQLAVDAYGPIADNAGGIAEMSHQDPKVRERTDQLDAVGNTTAAIGKGFAIGSAAMTALALFAAFAQTAGISGIDISKPVVMAALFVGGMLPFLFSAMAMKAVGEAAMEMIEEVRRQFREIPGLKEGKEGVKPDTAKCVDISTRASLKKMIAPGALAITAPVIVGFGGNLLGDGMGAEALGGLLAGVTVSGVLLAIFMSNAGGAWDNAKKSFEGGGYKTKDGTILEKGSDAHNAAVVGDTVGDPFKDTAGPSLNILVKLMSVVALVIAPLIATGTSLADVGGGLAAGTIGAVAAGAGAMGDAAGAVADGAGDAVGAVGDGVGAAAGAVADGAGAVVDGAGEAAEAVADGAEAVADGAEAVVDGAADVAARTMADFRGYDLRAVKTSGEDGTVIRLQGAVPSEEMKTAVINAATTKFADYTIDSEDLSVRESVEIPAAGWGDVCDNTLTALDRLPRGELLFKGNAIAVRGEAPAAELEAIRGGFSSLPEGWSFGPIALPDSTAADACDTTLHDILGRAQINFETGGAVIDPASEALLAELKTAIDACPESTGLAIDGHTDNVGADEPNQVLSQNRANAVKAALVRLGVAGTRLSATGYGEARPLVPNNSAENKAKNRRIEIHLQRAGG